MKKRKNATPEEIAERRSALKTQGVKGCKAIRINMAFTPENHDYIKVMAKLYGKSMTEYLNEIIEYYSVANGEVYSLAKKLQKRTKKA